MASNSHTGDYYSEDGIHKWMEFFEGPFYSIAEGGMDVNLVGRNRVSFTISGPIYTDRDNYNTYDSLEWEVRYDDAVALRDFLNDAISEMEYGQAIDKGTP